MSPTRETLGALLACSWDINSHSGLRDMPVLWNLLEDHDFVEWYLD
jgi:hypothetical protein